MTFRRQPAGLAERTSGGFARPPNTGMKLTKLRAAPVWPAEVPPCAFRRFAAARTASQLIPGVGQTMMRTARVGMLSAMLVGALACDTMIASRIIIQTPAAKTQGAELQSGLAVVRETLRSSGLRAEPRHSDGEMWIWHDPERPPDLHVTIAASFGLINVHVQQGLYGPIGPSAKYQEVKAALLETARGRYGKKNVRIE